MRVCTSCGENKPNSFYARRARPSTKCKKCEGVRNKQWRAKNRSKEAGYDRKHALKRKYGLTPEQYDDLLAKQNHQCAVCGKPQSKQKKRMAVDHDHHTLEIRGLLCTWCNHKIVGRHRRGGLLKPAADYIEGEYTGFFAPPPQRKKRKRRAG